ncbi:hypothetical protein DL96DRAFT_1468070, partial [Flagelloscypha sp. PMI_526]
CHASWPVRFVSSLHNEPSNNPTPHTYLDGTIPFTYRGLWVAVALHSTATFVLRGWLRFVWPSGYALSQYFPVPLWPLWLCGLFFL